MTIKARKYRLKPGEALAAAVTPPEPPGTTPEAEASGNASAPDQTSSKLVTAQSGEVSTAEDVASCLERTEAALKSF